MIRRFFLLSLPKKFLFVFFGVSLIVAAALLLVKYTPLGTMQADYLEETEAARKEIKVVEPIVLFGMVINDLAVVEDQVKKNQLFFDLFKSVYVPQEVVQQLNTLSKKVFDFRKVKAHTKYTLIHENDSLKTARALVYEPNAIDYIIFHLKDSLQLEICKRPVVTLEKFVSGRIESSLSETIEAMNISHELTNKFVDIFGWQVDFQRLQKGDQFKLIYLENMVEGKSMGIEKVLAIYFEHFGKGEYAFPFDQGTGVDYFDEDGKSLRKAFLRYPIEFTRISSRYNLNRFHPVAKVFRAHLGTDFAAPTGTPIRSVGEGTVLEARYSANNGNYVKIRHNNTYTTGYLHMSRIASGIVAGRRVAPGQIIGFVGSTGLATGPHLCYRFWRNGVQVDALRVDMPRAKPIAKEFAQQFEETKKSFISRLHSIPFPPPSVDAVIVAGN